MIMLKTSLFETLFVVFVTLLSLGVLTLARRKDDARVRLFLKLSAAMSIALYLAARIADTATWRSTPAILVLILELLCLDFIFKRARVRTALLIGAGGTVILALNLALLYALPLRDLTPPGGSYAVGSVAFMVEDDARTGVYLDAPGQNRRFMVQAFYPAGAGAEAFPRLAWIEQEGLSSAFASFAGLPAFSMSHLRRIQANARVGAPAAEGRYPVLIFSHGWTGSKIMHYDLAEELASRGIITLLTDHPYGGLYVGFPDGSGIPWHEDALPERAKTTGFLDAARYLVGSYAADIQALVRQLRSGGLPSPLAGQADGSRIALGGHSTGGGAAVLAAMGSSGIAGLVALDAWVEPLGEETAAGLSSPQLHIGSAQWKGGLNEPWLAKLEAASGPWVSYRLKGSTHVDFAMIRYITKAAGLIGWAGGLPERRYAELCTEAAANWLEALFSGSSTPYERLPLGDEALFDLRGSAGR
jgi:predicted dienelactone hydrolase